MSENEDEDEHDDDDDDDDDDVVVNDDENLKSSTVISKSGRRKKTPSSEPANITSRPSKNNINRDQAFLFFYTSSDMFFYPARPLELFSWQHHPRATGTWCSGILKRQKIPAR